MRAYMGFMKIVSVRLFTALIVIIRRRAPLIDPKISTSAYTLQKRTGRQSIDRSVI